MVIQGDLAGLQGSILRHGFGFPSKLDRWSMSPHRDKRPLFSIDRLTMVGPADYNSVVLRLSLNCFSTTLLTAHASWSRD